MFDTNVDDDRGSSIAFLDGSASPEAGHLSIARRRRRWQSPKRVARALLVMRGEVVVGMITSYDTQGERPLQFLNGSGLTRHSEIEVGHIMTSWDEVSTVDLPWVSSATVAEVAERFRRKGDSHFVVVEYADQGGAFVRGMISRAELERRLQQAV